MRMPVCFYPFEEIVTYTAKILKREGSSSAEVGKIVLFLDILKTIEETPSQQP